VIVASTCESLREQLSYWRDSGERIALVPTMGNLHDGHLSLISLAREHAERVVVSIFINPTQFDEDVDFDKYPRTLESDTRQLEKTNVDLLFIPDIGTMYPFGITNATLVTVPVLSEEFCGAFRPGHFDGVTSIISRLFNIIQPDVAIFGQKDYQQQLIIRYLVEDLQLPLQIVLGPIQRELDGIAISSRNQYLSKEERSIAPILYSVLQGIGKDLQTGKQNYAELEQQAIDVLNNAGFQVEYIAIREVEKLTFPNKDNNDIVVLGAVRLGTTRLIDNIIITI
jgi:pantoate--beta-alanine ligase